MAIEQWGFFSVPHLLWHGSSVYNGHLRGPVTLTYIAERFSDLGLSRPGIRTSNFHLRGGRSSRLRHRHGGTANGRAFNITVCASGWMERTLTVVALEYR